MGDDMKILNPYHQSKWVIDYPMRNILRGQLIHFQPKGEPMLNIRGKRRPREKEPHFGEKIELHSSSLCCCETREEEENPNPAAVDSRRKRRPTRID